MIIIERLIKRSDSALDYMEKKEPEEVTPLEYIEVTKEDSYGEYYIFSGINHEIKGGPYFIAVLDIETGTWGYLKYITEEQANLLLRS